MESAIRKTLTGELGKIPGARLITVTLAPGHSGTVAWAVVRTPLPVSPERVAQLNDLINHIAGSTVDLHVRSVLTADTTREGYVYEPQSWSTKDPGEP
jgi:hypothetical protein